MCVRLFSVVTQPAFNCLKLAMEAMEQCVISVQSKQRHQNDIKDAVALSLLLTLNRYSNFCFGVSIVDFEQVLA